MTEKIEILEERIKEIAAEILQIQNEQTCQADLINEICRTIGKLSKRLENAGN